MRLSSLLASTAIASLTLLGLASPPAQAAPGYLRDPALSGTTLVFDDEQSVWSAPLQGGNATRLTAPIGTDPHPILSPDGKQVAFLANYDGPQEIYVMPVEGGTARRVTFENQNVMPIGWDRKAGILYSSAPATGPGLSRVVSAILPVSGTKRTYPLADANDAALSADGQWLYFVRFGTAVSHDHLRLYRGGAVAQLWRYRLKGGGEAERLGPQNVNLRRPMLWKDRLIVISDQSGRDNLWSYALDGTDGHPLTQHDDFGIRQASLSGHDVVYQRGADLYHFDLDTSVETLIPVDVVSDNAARRPQWLDNPFPYLTDIDLAPNGKQVALTLRGHVALASAGPQRRITLATAASTRLRHASLSPDGKTLYAFSDKGGESELWAFPATGGAEGTALTHASKSEPTGLWVSPDGTHIAHIDLAGHLYVLDVATRTDKLIDDARLDGQSDYESVVWSHDGRALAFTRARGDNVRRQIALYPLETGATLWATTPDYDSYAPRFSPDGHFLWFLSDRLFKLSNGSPWGDRNPAPVFGPRTGIFALALHKSARFPFAPHNELEPAAPTKPPEKPAASSNTKTPIFDPDGLAARLYQLPVPAADYSQIEIAPDYLYLLAKKPDDLTAKNDGMTLYSVKVTRDEIKPKVFAADLRDFSLTPDGKTLMLVSGKEKQRPKIQLVPAGATLGDAGGPESQVSLDGLRLRIDPGAEWQDMFTDAWRLHRDHFYDPALHGVDWNSVRERYRPLLARIGDRSDLDDLLGQMMGELNALHSQLRPAETTTRDNETLIAGLGAHLTRQPGGFLIDRIYTGNPDLPQDRAPLAAPDVDAQPGDLIVSLNGQSLADLPDLSSLLANQAGKQVLLTLKRKDRQFQTIVTPVSAKQEASLRLRAWESERAARVEKDSHGRIGYLHLRAMGPDDIAAFTRDFYAQTDKDGLIIDVRRNLGGNIDSWVLSQLLRKVWMFWSDHGKASQGNMQQAFRGHIVVLCDEFTYSDGETFSQGVKALGIGPLIGMRTAGAGVWLSDSDRLADNGLPRTAQHPYFDMKGHWLVENHGVEPDIAVENMPVATFNGQDQQLDKALETLNGLLQKQPITPMAAEGFSGAAEALPH
ncbi:S41 family peptidase [Asaia sp. As-1742]|uniref:S41 family peptidase n=1 Tax=Asaia sp. As-1742 TaxID=2608325 RepID=UPI00141E8A12|nr:S41 family peptidase [Asaia sp. As-1742]NIE78714.1 Tricorn protease-like protein [Asaia sp. As-1742]